MTTLSWLLTQVRPDAAGFWLLLDVLAGLALWASAHLIPSRWRSLATVARWTLPAYLALLVGAVSPQQIGLSGIDWEVGLRLGLGFVIAVLGLLAVTHLAARQPQPLYTSPTSASTTVYGILYHGCEQFHWCFQRAAVLALFLSAPGVVAAPAYWSTWVATLFALPGVLLTQGSAARIYKAVALVATAILFFYTRNFWLCWALHAGIMLFAGSRYMRVEQATPEIQ